MADGPTNGNGRASYSSREVFDMLLDVRDRLGKVENKLDTASTERAEDRARIRALELKFYGILAGLGGIALVSLRIATAVNRG